MLEWAFSMIDINKPLISVIVLCYKNFVYTFDALDSILTQDYENIELIVSNDCSDDFDVDLIAEYIQNNKKSNITNVIINKNDVNMGTVRHCNKMLQLASGQYLKLIAADDAFYLNTALSAFVQFFNTTKSYVVASKAATYDKTLTKVQYIQPDEVSLRNLVTMKPLDFYKEMAKGCKIPAPSVCFNRKYFEEFGYFSEDYFLIEDWPTWLKMLRNGEKIDFLDIISVKYRSEIGNSNKTDDIGKKSPLFEKDYYNIIKKEILPFRQKLGKLLWRKIRYRYIKENEWNKFTIYRKYLFCVLNFDIFIGRIIRSLKLCKKS